MVEGISFLGFFTLVAMAKYKTFNNVIKALCDKTRKQEAVRVEWRYSLVKIDEDLNGEPMCLLLELCAFEDEFGLGFFREVQITSFYELQKAFFDVTVEGVNHTFYEEGEFHRDEFGVLRWECF